MLKKCLSQKKNIQKVFKKVFKNLTAPPCHRPLSVRSCVRLPLEDGSDRRETLAKRVSDDSRHLIFRRPKFLWDKIFGAKSQHEIKNRPFWRSYEFLSVSGRFSTKNHPISVKFQVSTFLGEGVQRRFSIFSLTFGPKQTYTFSLRRMI